MVDTSWRNRILKCRIVENGNTFTASDLAKSLDESREIVSSVLNHLTAADDIYQISSGRYSARRPGAYLLSKRWDKNLFKDREAI